MRSMVEGAATATALRRPTPPTGSAGPPSPSRGGMVATESPLHWHCSQDSPSLAVETPPPDGELDPRRLAI